MRAHTRFTQRLAVVAAMALIFALAAVGGASMATAVVSPGESNHCALDATQVRFEGAGTDSDFTMTVVDSKTWTWVYTGEMVIDEIWAFGGNTLKAVPFVEGATSGTIDAVALNLLNEGNQIAGISHVDFCLYKATEPETIEVIPTKVWDFGDADVPADGLAVVTVDAGGHGSMSWSFDTDGTRDSDEAFVLPADAVYVVNETVTEPEGFTCELDEVVQPVEEPGTVVVYNTCVADDDDNGNGGNGNGGNGNGGTLPPFVLPTETPAEPETPTEPDELVLGEVVEVPATTEAVEVAAEQLPRTGGESAGLALAGFTALTLGAGLAAVARRRELVS